MRDMFIPQGTQGPATTSQRPSTNRDVQQAAQDLRDAINNNVQRELQAEAAREAARAARADAQAAAQGLPPTARIPGIDIVRGPGGGTTIQFPPGMGGPDRIPPEAVDISIAFFITCAAIIIGWPLSRAFARRMDRRGASGQVPGDIANQLTQLNQAVDAIAVEVERISEGQRFTSRLLSEQQRGQSIPSSTGTGR